ncbi:MAG: phage head closure protein [Pararhodobacter sp.]|nr:phage head closure protein [Pararhodobacter sp.]
MRAGKLRYRIKLQSFTETVDEYGVPALVWADVATLRAELIQQSASEFIRAQGAVEDELVIFRTRFLDSITNAMRVMFDGNPHDIREIAPDPMRRHMELRTVTRRPSP